MNNGFFNWDKVLTDWLFAKWFFALIPCILIALSPLWKRSKLLFTYLSYCCISAISTWFLDYGLDRVLKFRTRPEILYWFMTLLVGIGFMYAVPVKKGRKALQALFYLNLGWILVGTSIWGEPYAGIYCNISLSLTLLAILFSFDSRFWELSNKKYMAIMACLIATSFYLCHSLMGTIAIVGGVSLTLFLKWENKKKWLTLPLIALVMGGFGAKEIYDRTKQLPDASFMERIDKAVATSSRVSTWKMAWKTVNHGPQTRRIFFGYGYGTWSSLGMILQAPTGFKKGIVYNIQMHNDMLQILFELGWVGLTLWFLLILDIINRSRKRKSWSLVYFGIALLISSLGNFPRYLPIEHFAFFLVLKELYLTDTETQLQE